MAKAVPLCIPSNWDYDGSNLTCNESERRDVLKLCEQGMNVLKALGDEKVVLISVVGPARSGKSFLTSRLAEGANFEIGHSPIAKTTGIWIGTGRLPTGCEHRARMVYLDVEGTNSAASIDHSSNNSWDTKILVLCFLVSSVIVYNSVKTPNENDLKTFHFISHLSNSVWLQTSDHLQEHHKQNAPPLQTLKHLPQQQEKKVKVVQETDRLSEQQGGNILSLQRSAHFSEQLKDNAPSLFWVLRDMTLDLADTGVKTWREFLEKHVFTEREENTNDDVCHNQFIKTINEFFSSYEAEGLPLPSVRSKVCKDILNSDNASAVSHFVQALDAVVAKIIRNARAKKLWGQTVSAKQLCTLLEQYVKEVNRSTDCLPIETAWQAALNHQTRNILEISQQKYQTEANSIELPCKSSELNEKLEMAKKHTTEYFNEVCKLKEEPSQQKLTADFQNMISNEFVQMQKNNEQKSLLFCRKIASELITKEFDVVRQFKTQSRNNFSIEWRAEVKEEILKLFDGATAGYPLKDEVRCNLEGTIESEFTEISIWNEIDKILTNYEQSTKSFETNFPCEENKVTEENNNLHLDARRKMESVLKKSKETTKTEAQSKLFRLFQDLNDYMHDANILSSRIYCERVMKSILKKIQDRVENPSFWHYFSKLERADMIKKYKETAKGPMLSQVEKEFVTELDKLLLEEAVGRKQLKPFWNSLSSVKTMFLSALTYVGLGSLAFAFMSLTKRTLSTTGLLGLLMPPFQILKKTSSAIFGVVKFGIQAAVFIFVLSLIFMQNISNILQSHVGLIMIVALFIYVVLRSRGVIT